MTAPWGRQQLIGHNMRLLGQQVYGITPYLLQLALTDFQTGKHWFSQKASARHGNIFANESVVNYSSFGRLEQEKDAMVLTAKTDEFELELNSMLSKV